MGINIRRTILLFCCVIVFMTGCAGKNNVNHKENTMENDVMETTAIDQNYISVDGTKLMDGEKEIRFVSLNYPQATSDTAWEQENAIKTIAAMGGNVTRSYTIPVFNGNNSGKAYVTGVDEEGNLLFDENALNNLDNLLAVCNKYEIHLIIPLVDHWHWIGGMDGYVWLAGEAEGNEPDSSSFQDWAWKFYSSETCKDYFKQMISHLLERENSVTGVKYKDDPAILCWETANEAGGNQTNQQTYDDILSAWTIEMVNHIKSIDSNHLVLDGRMSMTEQSMSAENPADILGAHYYEGNYATRCADDTKAAHEAGKPFILGEFGAKVEAAPCIEVFQAGVDSDTNGIMMWSLRAHKDGYGFYFHDEDGYWASYHWPGFVSGDYYGEKEILRAIYAYAQIANGNAADYEEAKLIPIAAPETEEAPLLYESSFTDGSVGDMKWRGVVGGAWYEIQRANGIVTEETAETAEWMTIAGEADNVYDSGRNWENKEHDCIAGYHDETAVDGQTYSYRIRACNESGVGIWSNIVTVEHVKHVVADPLDLIAVSSDDPNPAEIRNVYSYDHSTNIECKDGIIANNSDTEGYIEYRSMIPVESISVVSLDKAETGSDLKICVSADGIHYTELAVQCIEEGAEYSVSDVSASEKYYCTRIYLAEAGKCRLDQITIVYQNDGKSYREAVDGAEPVVNAMIQDDTFGFQASPLYTYKTANLEQADAAVMGITASDKEAASIVYMTKDDINAYRVAVYERDGISAQVEYSYDGVTYYPANILSSTVEGDYNKVIYGEMNVADVVRAVQIVFPAGSGNDVVLKSVEISSGIKSIPLGEAAPVNVLEDGEYYFGNNKNIAERYVISQDGKEVAYRKDVSAVDFSLYDCVYAWVQPDDSGDELRLEFTDKDHNVWSSNSIPLDGTEGSVYKFSFSDFTCENASEMDLHSVKDFAIVISQDSEGTEGTASISLDKNCLYGGNYGIALEYAFDRNEIRKVYVDSIYLSSSSKIDDFEGYNGSDNLLNASYSRNTSGGTFDISLDSEHKLEGSYGLKICYSYDGTGYAGATKNMDLLNLSGYDGFMMYVESDGSGNDIKVQVETDISTFSYTGYLTGNGPAVYYMPFSAMKEEAWAGSGHVLDSSQNLISVSIYTDLVGDVTSGVIYVDNLRGADFIEDLESQAIITMDYEDGTVISEFPCTISGTASYVDYISLRIGDKVFNIPVDENDTWSYTIDKESGILNEKDMDIQAGVYYPNNDLIAADSETAKKITVDVAGNDDTD